MLSLDDLKSHITVGTMDAITDDTDALAQGALDAAISEAKGFCSLYDVDALFAGTPDDPILKQHIKSMAKWHLMALTNVNIDWADTETRYNQATMWLRSVQSGKVVQPNWPLRTVPAGKDTYFHSSSRAPKRNNHY